jgi:hypothetical protein
MSNVARNRPQPQERSVALASPTSMPTVVQQSLTAAARLPKWFGYASARSWMDRVKTS